MTLGRLAYDFAMRAAPRLLRLAKPFSEKLRRGEAGRSAALARLQEWAAAERDARRPLYWLHAPSVGEALMAQAIVAEVRTRRPDAQVVFTFFSPSAERVAARVGADTWGYLPWDSTSTAAAALAALRPTAIGFVRTEVWPAIVSAAGAAGVRVCLLNAVLASGSSRLRSPARQLLARGYRRLDAVGAVAAEDAGRFERLGVLAERIHLTGDARFDQVLARVATIDPDSPLLAPFRDGVPTIVAGSTWAADEDRLLPALAALRRRLNFRIIVAPHEPTAGHLARLETSLRRYGLVAARLGAVEAARGLPSDGGRLPDAVVVDRVGVLAELYAIADTAYVGGGFGTAGLHSVVEPAALGVPVVFGPALGNAREAWWLADAGGGIQVANADGVKRALGRLLEDPDARAIAGTAARAFVESRLGGAAANAALLLRGG